MAIRFQLYRAYADDPRASSSHPYTRESVKAPSDSLTSSAPRVLQFTKDVISQAMNSLFFASDKSAESAKLYGIVSLLSYNKIRKTKNMNNPA